MVRYGDDAEALWVLIPFSVVLIVLLVLCIIGCIRHRKDPKSTSEKPLAETSGFHMSGLPCAGTPNVDLKLYRDKILFEIWLNHTGTKTKLPPCKKLQMYCKQAQFHKIHQPQ